MPVFGKSFVDYLRFARGILILIVAVGAIRLVLSMATNPDIATVFSLNVVGLIAVLYFGIRTHTSGFGSYRQLLILILMQAVLSQTIIGLGITLAAITGIENVYSEFEMAGVTSHWIHAASHVGLSPVFGLIQWGMASLVMLVAKFVVKRPASV